MKIQRLLLKAFGPFSEVELNLAAPPGTVNVLFGENEAGKSSALRALEGLCFGIEDRTTDNHVHSYDQMRVGATLELADGSRSTFIRRKGKKNTLMDATGTAVPDAVFERFLCGVGRSGFEALFCLSYQRLSEGSKSILDENGELGKLLFEARSDLSLRSVQATLIKRAEDLYKGTARSPATIDKALSEYDSYRKILKRGDLTEYREIQTRLAVLEENKGNLEKERADFRSQSARLRNHQAAIPLVRRLHRARVGLSELGQVPELGSDFTGDFIEATERSLTAQSAAENAANLVASLEKRLSEITLNTAVLQWRGEIDRLNRQIDRISKHQEDLPDEEKKATRAASEARSSLARIRPGEEPEPENLNIDFGRNRIANLGRDKARLDQELVGAEAKIASIEKGLTTTRLQLEQTSAVRISTALAPALKAGRLLEEKASGLAGAMKEARSLELACELMSKRLGAGERSLKEYVGTVVPTRSVVHGFDDQLQSLDAEIRNLKTALAKAENEASDAKTKRMNLLLEGSIPTDSELQTARKSRDEQWKEIKDKVTSQTPVDSANCTEFERRISHADDISDRLRREADRSATLVAIDTQLQILDDTKNSHESAVAVACSKREDVDRSWQEHWRPAAVEAAAPRQMLEWLDRYDQLCKDVLALEDAKIENADTAAAVESARTNLASALGQPKSPFPLSDLIVEADSLLRLSQQTEGTIDALRSQVRSDEASLAAAHAEIEQIREKIEQWKSSWAEVTACLRLPQIPTPEEADAAVKAISESLEKLTIASIAEKRVQGMRTDILVFSTDTQKVVEATAPVLSAMPALAAVQSLYASLKAAERHEATHSTLSMQLDEQKLACEAAARQYDLAQARLTALCSRAGCGSVAQLDDVVHRHTEATQFRSAIQEVSVELMSLASEGTLDELCESVIALDPFVIENQLNDFTVELERLDIAIGQINQDIGVERTNLAALDQGKTQVETQLLAEAALAQVRSSVRPYLIYMAAELLLRAQIEEFRKANQGPILKKAGEIFSVLTDGSFAELTAELDDKDQPVLIAVRKSRATGAEERLKVEALSSATRIGLYLALRLACVYHHIEQREGLPFVADDILLDFDDTRSRRVMEELGRLAEKTQVILFTHHRHLVDIGREVLGDRCLVQNLARSCSNNGTADPK